MVFNQPMKPTGASVNSKSAEPTPDPLETRESALKSCSPPAPSRPTSPSVLGRIAAWWAPVGVAARQRARPILVGSAALAAILACIFPMDVSLSSGETAEGVRVIARRLSWWGEFHLLPLIWVGAIAAAGVIWKRRHWLEGAISGLAGGAAAGILVMLAKILFGRPRPSERLADGFYWLKFGSAWASFPSGHAAHCFGMAVGVSMVLPRFWPASIAFASLVAWSRFALHRHYVSDLLAGAWIGVVAGVIFGLAARRRLASCGADRAIQPPINLS